MHSLDTNDLVLHTLLPTQVTDIVHALSGYMTYLSTHHCPRRRLTLFMHFLDTDDLDIHTLLPTQVTDIVHALSGYNMTFNSIAHTGD